MWPTPSRASAGAGHSAVRIDEIGGPHVEIRRRRSGRQNFLGQRLEPALAGDRGQRLLLGLERQIEVFQPLGAVGGVDLRGQLGRELALDSIDRRIVCFRSANMPQPADAGLDLADLLFVQPAGLVLAIAA